MRYVPLVCVYRVMVLILLWEYLPKQCLHSLNMNEYIKHIWFLRTSHEDMVLRDNKPIFLANFFSTVLIWSIFNSGIFKGNLSLVEFLWNKVYLVSVTFEDNLFALNQPHIFWNSQFTVPKRVFMFWWE